MLAPVKPIVLALVLCDTIIREVGTNKLSLIGTFNNIFAQNFPCVHPNISVYVAITEVHGRVPCELRMTSLDQGLTVFKLPGQIEIGGPTPVAELAFQLQQIRFDQAGSYAIEFWGGGTLLVSRKLHVQKMEQRQA
ncbi:MAG: hypothetical protein V1899_01860 [Planctomycetota bacterium]